MGKWFGTDGIRGVVNRHPMTTAMAMKAGMAVGLHFGGDGAASCVVGRDTRQSGTMLAAAVSAGICSTGMDVVDAGVLPTPALAYLARARGAAAAVVVSASHNPYEDNGIKVFKGNGFKLSEAEEDAIERLMGAKDLEERIAGRVVTGQIAAARSPEAEYADFLMESIAPGERPDGAKLVIDCSNGATYHVAPELFRRLGATVTVLSASPDGRNINRDCGSQHPENLSRAVVAEGADAGLAFDGDGDRMIAVDERGGVLTGDQVLAILAGHLQAVGRIGNGTVVSTVMSNLGLKEALSGLGLRHVTSAVGDRHVMEKMVETGSCLGGEDSGHLILMDHHTTGDGLLSGLKLLEALAGAKGAPLSELAGVMTVYPQRLVNVPVTAKPPLSTLGGVSEAIGSAEAELGEKGRVLVRYSGTQQMCRVMVEGPTVERTEAICRRVAEAVREAIGA